MALETLLEDVMAQARGGKFEDALASVRRYAFEKYMGEARTSYEEGRHEDALKAIVDAEKYRSSDDSGAIGAHVRLRADIYSLAVNKELACARQAMAEGNLGDAKGHCHNAEDYAKHTGTMGAVKEMIEELIGFWYTCPAKTTYDHHQMQAHEVFGIINKLLAEHNVDFRIGPGFSRKGIAIHPEKGMMGIYRRGKQKRADDIVRSLSEAMTGVR